MFVRLTGFRVWCFGLSVPNTLNRTQQSWGSGYSRLRALWNFWGPQDGLGNRRLQPDIITISTLIGAPRLQDTYFPQLKQDW